MSGYLLGECDWSSPISVLKAVLKEGQVGRNCTSDYFNAQKHVILGVLFSIDNNFLLLKTYITIYSIYIYIYIYVYIYIYIICIYIYIYIYIYM